MSTRRSNVDEYVNAGPILGRFQTKSLLELSSCKTGGCRKLEALGTRTFCPGSPTYLPGADPDALHIVESIICIFVYIYI